MPAAPPPAETRAILLQLLSDRTLSVADVRRRAGVAQPEWNALLAQDRDFRSAYHAMRVKPEPRQVQAEGVRGPPPPVERQARGCPCPSHQDGISFGGVPVERDELAQRASRHERSAWRELW